MRRVNSLLKRIGYFIRKLIANVLDRIVENKARRGITDLAEWLDVPTASLRVWVYSRPTGFYYRTFSIPKKNGKGYRKIDAPNPQLKLLQKKLYVLLIRPLGWHTSATAYIPEKSIVDNALPHVDQKVVINIDLKDFFGSISSNKVYTCWRSLGWDFETSTILQNICCYNDCLPQGSPTSPAISNLCNQSLDSQLKRLVDEYQGHYTRYSDDLTFSFPQEHALKWGVIHKIREIITSEGYSIQKKKKIRVLRQHQRQVTTGLIVNKKVNLPRKTRKRIRAMQHHRDRGTLSEKDAAILRGYENLLNMIDSRVGQRRLPLIKEPIVEHKTNNYINIERGRVVIDQSQKFGGDVRIAANNSVVNLRDISGQVNNQIAHLDDSPIQTQLKDLLTQLTTAIKNEPNLNEEQKSEALEEVKEIAEAGQTPQDGQMKKAAKRAINALKGMTIGVDAATKFVEACNGLLPAIGLLFGL